jgi:thiosulfate/3-mercaptopyruvate sulfurtransferase
MTPEDTHPFLIEPDDLSAQLNDTVILDTRPIEDYEAGHIPDAISLTTYNHFVRSTSPIGVTRFQRFMASLYSEAGVSTERPVVVYEDRIGTCAARECWMLQYLGHPDAYMLNGGWQGWTGAGGAVETRASIRSPASFIVQPDETMMSGAGEMLACLDNPNALVLDVRSHEEHIGAGGVPCCPRQGRVPGAIWLEWIEMFDPRGGRFKTGEAIARVLEERRISPDRELFVYCHRGARAAIVFYALRLAGRYNVRNFIGAWHEWAARGDLPVEGGQ